MAKKKKQKIEQNIPKVKKNNLSRFLRILLNILFAGIAICVVYATLQFKSNSIILRAFKTDIDLFIKYPLKSATLSDRYYLALNDTYAYMEFLKINTSKDAVILYPEHSAFFPENSANQENTFRHSGISSKMWAIRFLYPRIIIKQAELKTSPYKDKVTDIAVVNGQGYELLPYIVKEDKRIPFGIYPVDISKVQQDLLEDSTTDNNKTD